VQYDLRKCMMFLDAFTLNKPDIFIGGCASNITNYDNPVANPLPLVSVKHLQQNSLNINTFYYPLITL
jgi:hypothetical protein